MEWEVNNERVTRLDVEHDYSDGTRVEGIFF